MTRHWPLVLFAVAAAICTIVAALWLQGVLT